MHPEHTPTGPSESRGSATPDPFGDRTPAAWYEDYIGAVNARDWARVTEHLDESVLVGGSPRTREQYVDDLRELLRSFPDYRWEVRELLADGDRLAVRLRTAGTRSGPFLTAPADGARVGTDEHAMYRLDGGRIAAVDSTADTARLTRLGPGGGRPVGTITQIVLECADPRSLAEFWRSILDLDPPVQQEDWTTLTWPAVGRLAFHRVEGYRPPPWPGEAGEEHMHLDLLVEEFEAAEQRVLDAGARPLSEVHSPGPRAWRVYADPEGHPFCLVSTPE